MAKKQKVNKTQAVRDYLKDHPKAMSGEIAAALKKQGIKITPKQVANIKAKINKARTAKKAAKQRSAVEIAAPAAVEKPTKAGDTITLDQVKKVAQTIKAIGGFQRVTEVLEVIRELGGVRKFKDLAAAMSATETDAIPY
jgi:arginine repressor